MKTDSGEGVAQEQTSTIHYLPCTIAHDGPLAVNSFFQIQKTKAGMISSLRGRQLVGKTLPLPPNVTGLNIVQDGTTSKTELSWDCGGHFQEIVVWQHDIAPDLGQLQDCFNWFEIADKVRHRLSSTCALFAQLLSFSTVAFRVVSQDLSIARSPVKIE
jgi:hypothetical protein